MIQHTGYQTLLLPNRTVVPGAFHTPEWFYAINQHMSFVDKTVIDVGCNDCMLGILALQHGARHVTGIDTRVDSVEAGRHLSDAYGLSDKITVLCGRAEDHPCIQYDIALLSMVIHWIDNAPSYLQKLNQDILSHIAIIFRSFNSGYSIPVNGKWFPVREDIDLLLSNFSCAHTETLLTQDNDKRIILGVYERCMLS